MGVISRDQDQLRLEALQFGQDDLVEEQRVFGVTAALESERLSVAPNPSPSPLSRQWPCRDSTGTGASKRRARSGRCRGVLRAVAMMNIDVDDRDPVETESSAAMRGRDRHEN